MGRGLEAIIAPIPIMISPCFSRDMPERAKEISRLAEVETNILYEIGAVINALPFPAAPYQQRTGFMSELRKDALDL